MNCIGQLRATVVLGSEFLQLNRGRQRIARKHKKNAEQKYKDT